MTKRLLTLHCTGCDSTILKVVNTAGTLTVIFRQAPERVTVTPAPRSGTRRKRQRPHAVTLPMERACRHPGLYAACKCPSWAYWIAGEALATEISQGGPGRELKYAPPIMRIPDTLRRN